MKDQFAARVIEEYMAIMDAYDSIDILEHVGRSKKDGAPGPGSGRYPLGSGENPYQRNVSFLAQVYELRKQGMNDVDIAKGMGMTTTVFRSRISLANSEIRKANVATALELKARGYSNVAIGEKMGINESSVRSLLNPALMERSEIARTTADVLKDSMKDGAYIDIGAGTEYQLGISRTKLKTAVELLEEEGYTVHNIQVEQMGTGNMTTVQVLAPPNTEKKDIYKNMENIKTVVPAYSEDGGRTYEGLEEPRSIDSKRIDIRYAESEPSGSLRDGLIEIRRGVPELDMGDAQYAQVRIAVDGTHYLKGMAVYADDLPDGVDIRFNTHKHEDLPLKGPTADESVLKPMKSDPDNPFGSTVRQKHYIDENGDKQLSALNIVYEEGEWSTWSKTLAAQMLSKQQPSLAKEQLELAYKQKLEEYNDISKLTMPALKQKMMSEFADECDAAAVDLTAAGMPRQASHVILPIPSLKDNEIYAPNYRDGESVILIRYPHGGKFEIPELIVNNRNKEAIDIMGNAIDAVGIGPKAAQKLSGADFDGDTVLVIPNNNGAIKTSRLRGLENFDHLETYHNGPNDPETSKANGFWKQRQMGDITNLITDMTIKGANDNEICRAVKHSMVIIDAEKHNLNWRQSAIDNGIAELKTKYQGGPKAGASTLISRSTSEERVPDRKLKPVSKMTAEEHARYLQGEKIWEYTGRTYMKPIKDKKTGEIKGYKETPKTVKSTKGAEYDPHKLSSGTLMEEIYAAHASRLKTLAKKARAESIGIPNAVYSPSAKRVYAKEVSSLMAKLNVALKHAPYERQAQILAGQVVKAKKRANPGMDADQIKKLKGRALTEARKRFGGGKMLIDISDKEWEAIQAGALSHNRQVQILANANPDRLKELATPRNNRGLTPAKRSQAQSMLNRGYTRAEVAEFLGISTTTLTKELNE